MNPNRTLQQLKEAREELLKALAQADDGIAKLEKALYGKTTTTATPVQTDFQKFMEDQTADPSGGLRRKMNK